MCRNVMYGWCVKCRDKYPEEYRKIEGSVAHTATRTNLGVAM